MRIRIPNLIDWFKFNGIVKRKLRKLPVIEDTIDGLETLETNFSNTLS